ncbi:MAG: DoxX family protein [Flavobacteriales bacterium]|jgi:uncharacterized membrane protein YphA (DoxX/SURF4 family)|nr:DoxX family protein [Flavobacteriales bacterium]
MKILVGISRIFVGILFIISGLIKLNDPVGFSFKLKDYFAPEVLDLEFLVPYALLIAIFVVIYEVLLGIMIIIGYAKKFTLWSLLLMILFFTFLTFYSAYFNKVTDCGCFGDALKLTPWESFTKDVVLLVLILIIFFGKKYIQPFFSKNTRSIIVFASFIGCLGITYYVLQHLPIIDFRPYKIGANIKEGMTIPEDAPKPIFEYQWKFEVDGQEKIITTNGDYPKVDGEFIGVETEEIQAGYEAPIHDFSMERGGTDYTETFLEEDHLIVVIAYSLSNAEMDGFIPVREVTNEALKKGYKVIGLSASSEEVTAQLVEQYELNFDFYFCDMTTLKTIVRSNPGLLELQNGTIMQKLHWNDADELQLEELPEAKPELNVGLMQRLDSIAVLDQKYRSLMQIEDEATRSAKAVEMGLESTMTNEAIWKLQQVIDSANMAFVERLFVTEGYPGKSVVGEPTNKVAWNVLQHNPDKIETYLPLIKKAGEAGELPFSLVAMMEDRYLMNQGKPQVYGTQGRTDESGSYIWPIKDPETVNDRRLAIGYTQTVEEYAKDLFGSDFIYEVRTIDELKH